MGSPVVVQGARDITLDAIFHGSLRVKQRRSGYRFTEDAVLVAAFAARGRPAHFAADLGAGCGVVGLMLQHVGAATHVVALELQNGLCHLAADNARQKIVAGRISVIRADLRRTPIAAGSMDLVVSNPPYTRVGAGRAPKGRERAVARHEYSCTPAALASEAMRCLSPGGRLAVIYPADRAADVSLELDRAGFRATRRRWVHPGPGRPPGLLLLEARLKHNGCCAEEPPLYSRGADGVHCEEMRRLVAGEFDAWALTGGAARL